MLLLILVSQALRHRQREDRRQRDVLESTEIPAEHIDPAAIDLTPLVNTLINSSQSGSRQLFSLLSVTSYSSLALHKLTLLVYNISSIRSIQSNMLRRRFCYCVTNETNDLTDFTAVLLDVVGNSTSYLHELFKSASILSVSQRNNSDCIYICVMAGKTGKEVPELWEVDSVSPLFNQTIVEGRWFIGFTNNCGRNSCNNSEDHHCSAAANGSTTRNHHATTSDHSRRTGDSKSRDETNGGGAKSDYTNAPDTKSDEAKCHNSPVTSYGKPDNSNSSATERDVDATDHHPTSHRRVGDDRCCSNHSNDSIHYHSNWDNPGCPWRRPGMTGESTSGSTTTVGAHKLQPCVLELCKFFSQCLCRPFDRRTRTKRYCDDSHLWYEKHTAEVCRRVRRVSFSRNLKQRCLTKMCNDL
ncbi:uncharacterized protein LOC120787415 [Xiphias gladius]|uniref:uncharacterized protein LOC120787415 n=1 Tax=Xiphias gladius TaxID=8245 RepID=UPI001A9A20FF|nr:uncharacterized protein LOC120787415 [Xiphias gladius]